MSYYTVCHITLYVILHCMSYREVVNQVQSKIGSKIFEAALSGKLLEPENFLDNDDKVKLKRCIFSAQVSLYNQE